MANEYIIILYYLMWGLLVFCAIVFLLSGLDDLFIDLYYWMYHSWRLLVLRKIKGLTYEKLAELPEKRIAVMVPCWHEAGVIEEMLRHNVYSMDYDHYDIFVGLYPNDPKTVESVRTIAKQIPHIHLAINKKDGPTTKADNLNSIYSHILQHEKNTNNNYTIFVLHDSEDIIHPLSFKLYNFLMPKNHMVQIPIFPLKIELRNFTHWTYNAEFSEIHTKDIIVREKIGGLVPSAGVGTAFSHEAMEALKKVRDGVPFSIDSLTEDYSTALQLRLQGYREIFVVRFFYRTQWQKKYFFFGPSVARNVKEYIATRALFPMSYTKAVRQKTRWILGISFQEWINTGWVGNISTIYTLMHDRKSIFTHLVNGMFFLLTPFWIIYSILTSNSPEYPTLQDLFEQHPWVWTLIVISSYLMINRILQRAISVYRVYGFIPAIWSIPLILYGNIINLHALLRAYIIFMFAPKTKSGSPAWDKTDHSFAIQNLLIPYKLRIGDMLIEQSHITKEQLTKALVEQDETGEQLGKVLVKLGYVSQSVLTQLLAKQYDLEIIPQSEIVALRFESIPYMSRYHYDCLIRENSLPIKVHMDTLTIAITDPSNDTLIAKIIKWIAPYKPGFVLMLADELFEAEHTSA